MTERKKSFLIVLLTLAAMVCGTSLPACAGEKKEPESQVPAIADDSAQTAALLKKMKIENCKATSFATLSGFKYELGKNEFPAEVKALNGQRVALRGLMFIGDHLNGQNTHKFLIARWAFRNDGPMPRIKDWVSVNIKESVRANFGQS